MAAATGGDVLQTDKRRNLAFAVIVWATINDQVRGFAATHRSTQLGMAAASAGRATAPSATPFIANL